MADYKLHILHTLMDGFIIKTSYMDTSILSHQLEIEVGGYASIPLEKRIFQLCD